MNCFVILIEVVIIQATRLTMDNIIVKHEEKM